MWNWDADTKIITEGWFGWSCKYENMCIVQALGRLGTAEEIAALVTYLAADEVGSNILTHWSTGHWQFKNTLDALGHGHTFQLACDWLSLTNH